MGFTPVPSEIKEKIITASLAGKGRNAIDRELKAQGIKVSHGSISNIINKHKREHEASCQNLASCNDTSIVELQSQPSTQTDMNKIDSPSLKPQDVNKGLVVPVNPNSTSIHRPKPRDGNPLSHLIVEDKDNPEIKPNPLQTKTNINNNEKEKYLHNQDETIKEEKQYQHRASLSDFENTSRRSYNPGKEDQDQEEEAIDLGIDWDRRFPRDESRSSLRNYKTRGSRSVNSITLDENWQSEFWGRVLQEKDEQQRRLRLIQHHQGLLEKQRQGLLELKQSLDIQSADIKTQKIELKEIEPLIPQLRELKNAGLNFTLLMQIVATLNEAAIFQNVAARNVAQEIRLCRELGGVKQAVEKARHQLSTMESLIQNQNNGVQPHVNVNNGYGLTVDSYAKLVIARGVQNDAASPTLICHIIRR